MRIKYWSSDLCSSYLRSMAPELVNAIDLALHLCSQTLQFTREGPAQLDLQRFDLRDLLTEVREALAEVGTGRAGWVNEVDRGFRIEADREQLYRVFLNLAHNALEAGARELPLAARPVRDFLVDRLGVGTGKGVSLHVDLGCSRTNKKKENDTRN